MGKIAEFGNRCRGTSPWRREHLWMARSLRPQTSNLSRSLRTSPLAQEAAHLRQSWSAAEQRGNPTNRCMHLDSLAELFYPEAQETHPPEPGLSPTSCPNKLASPRMDRLGGKLDLALPKPLPPSPPPRHGQLRLTLERGPYKGNQYFQPRERTRLRFSIDFSHSSWLLNLSWCPNNSVGQDSGD